MAISDYLITASEVAQVHVEKQADVLTGTPLENKQVFDSYPELIKGKHNSFVNYAEQNYVKEASIVRQIGSQLFPVGTILNNTTNINPSTYLGFGTWILLKTIVQTFQRNGQDNATVNVYQWERYE